MLNSTEQIKIDVNYSQIIDLNNSYYYLNNKDKIYILNKKNLNLIKTININLNKINSINQYYYYYNNYFTILFKISDKIVTLFIVYDRQKNVYFHNYQISMSGIKWELEKEDYIMTDKINKIKLTNNNILFSGENNLYLVNTVNAEKQYSKCIII